MARRQDALATRDTLAAGRSRDTLPATMGEAGGPGTMAFPDLDDEHERRMEEMVAARLFPRRAVPLKIGRYSLLDPIGQGGMGIVYAAYDPELDRRVAIKVLTASQDDRGSVRLRREAQAMARVVHANVVSVIEVGEHEGSTYVVMEYLRGISLDKWPARRPDWRATLQVYVQAGRGLAAAHRAGVIHRDFKPHNAMLVEGGVDDGRVKVLDFGLARAGVAAPGVASEAPTAAFTLPLTQTGALMGTPAYMAPEQLIGEPSDERSDQFSFAASVYEALYGQLPFEGTNLIALTQSVVGGAVRPVPAGAEVPGWVLRVLLRGLARRPEDRHPSMTALCDALERDPAARRRTVGLAVMLSAVVGAGGWGVAQLGAAAESPCSGPAFELTEVWGDERAAAVEAAFAATGLPYAADAARRVRPIVDEYAAGWTATRRETCEAHRRGEQSAPLLDLRMACLDRRRTGLVTFTGLLAQADGPVVERAVEAALRLPALTDCSDVAALTAETPPPDDPASASAVAATRGRLAEVGALASIGRFTAAAAAAERALAEARDIGFDPLIAESALALGTIALEQGQGAAAEAALSLALARGIAGRADRAAAEALIRRYFVRGALLGQPERAAGDAELVAAHAARFPHDGGLQWLAAINSGAVAYTAHDVERARGLYEQALAVVDGPTDLDLARTRLNLGLLEFDARNFEAALAAQRAAIEQVGAALGESHPLVLEMLTYEASSLYALGRRQAARERLERYLAARAGGDTASQRAVWPSIQLARLDADARRYSAAQAHAGRALAATDPTDVLTWLNAETAMADALTDPDAAQARYLGVIARGEATYGEAHAITAGLQQRVASGLLRLGRASAALPVARRSLATYQQDPSAAPAAATQQILADIWLALGDHAQAADAARAAVAIFKALPGDHVLDLARARRSLGRAQLAQGEVAAVATLRLALSVVEARLDADDPELAGLRLELAQAELATEPAAVEQARALLVAARDAYRGLGEAFAGEQATAERLLAGL